MKQTFLCSVLVCITLLLLFSCNKQTKPKPDGYLRLEYPEAVYENAQAPCAFTFEINKNASIAHIKDCSFRIVYPNMNASIYMDYKRVTSGNLDSLLRDAQRLTFNHTIKAEDIKENLIIDEEKKVYGMFYELIGNTATNVQFYATDSTRNFVIGSLYFYAKPNFDSILPATHYVKEDMLRLIETLEWKEQAK